MISYVSAERVPEFSERANERMQISRAHTLLEQDK